MLFGFEIGHHKNMPFFIALCVVWCYAIQILLVITPSFAETDVTTTDIPEGLTYRLYENAAIAGKAAETGQTKTVELSLSRGPQSLNYTTTNDCLLSGELEGSVEFHHKGIYTFQCLFQHTSTGFVWLDGHLICSDGHAYEPRDEIDNPIPIINLERKSIYPFRAHITSNDTYHCCTSLNLSAGIPCLQVYWKRDDLPISKATNDVGLTNRNMKRSLRRPVASSQLFVPMTHHTNHTQHITNNQIKILKNTIFASFHPDLPSYEQKRERLQRKLKQGWGFWLRSNILSIVKLPEGILVNFQFCHHQRVRLDSTIPGRNQLYIHELQEEVECLDTAVPDSKGIIKVDLHAYDRSYVAYNITLKQKISMQLECSVSGKGKQQLLCLITVLDILHTDKNSNMKENEDEFNLLIVPRYAWYRPGNISVNDNNENLHISFTSPGLGVIDFVPIVKEDIGLDKPSRIAMLEASDDFNISLKFSLGSPDSTIGFYSNYKSTNKIPYSLAEIKKHLQTKKAEEKGRIHCKYGRKASIAEAIQAAVMWTMIYNPIENGPFMPVSRSENWSFAQRSGATASDWTYVVFDWDNLFASLLAGLDNKEIAYSNLFQVVKSKTAAGFIPNWSTGGVKSQDRTEPPIGARVLWELYKKYNEKWIIEALWDDLLDWNDWFMSNRILQPFGLVGLGSHYESHSPGTRKYIVSDIMQAARWESGLDNSPMYDGNDLFDDKTHMMQMYDVGMSSLVAQEAYYLAKLADVIDKDAVLVKNLRERGDYLPESILAHLWDPSRQIFANRYQFKNNASFVSHITPTSFYPFLLAHSTSVWDRLSIKLLPQLVDQVVKSWLLNSTRFCITKNGDFVGNDSGRCYWGLPSVSADDPQFMNGNFHYWRGLLWGPMSQIVYWSLQKDNRDNEYLKNNTSATDQARKALCRQMEVLMMSQWTTNRHICENYSPYKNASDCSGTLFYHWGALNGLIGMVEDRYW